MHLGALYSQRARGGAARASRRLRNSTGGARHAIGWSEADWISRKSAPSFMEGTEDETYQTGIADLAKADAAIARLTSR